MLLSLLTPPAVLPLTLEEAKAHARVEVDEEDALISGLIASAVEFAETYTQRALVEQQWEASYDCFPEDRWIDIPRPPLLSVDEIVYLDSNGDEQTLDAANYRVIAPVGPTCTKGRVLLRSGKTWPAVIDEQASVTVRFTAGYGAYEADVPQQIKTALAIYVAELYENRESTVLTGAVLQEIPFSVQNLLWPFVVEKFGL